MWSHALKVSKFSNLKEHAYNDACITVTFHPCRQPTVKLERPVGYRPTTNVVVCIQAYVHCVLKKYTF